MASPNDTISSDFNLQSINTKQFADNLRATIDFGGNLMAIGQRGTGKTEIVQSIINELKLKEVYFNLSLYERPDLAGYPNFFGAKPDDKYLGHLMPQIYKALLESDEPCVAVLDEVDKAEKELLAPLLEFTRARSMNGHKFKNLKACVMTGNLMSEGGRKPPPTLMDRTEAFLVRASAKEWLEWGSGKIHSSIFAYISENPNELIGSAETLDNYKDRSPRTWHMASDLLKFGEKRDWHPDMMLDKISACVGKQSGMHYSAYFEHYRGLMPIILNILAGEPVKGVDAFENTKQLVLCIMLCSKLVEKLDEIKIEPLKDIIFPKETAIMSENIARFLSDHIDKELAFIAIRNQIGSKRVSDFKFGKLPVWEKLLEKFVEIQG